jgi:hypothetical protein
MLNRGTGHFRDDAFTFTAPLYCILYAPFLSAEAEGEGEIELILSSSKHALQTTTLLQVGCSVPASLLVPYESRAYIYVEEYTRLPSRHFLYCSSYRTVLYCTVLYAEYSHCVGA